MSGFVEWFPIERLYLWDGLLAIIGVSIIISSVTSILAGEGNLSHVTIVGGIAILVGATYEASARDPDAFGVNGRPSPLLCIQARKTTDSVVDFYLNTTQICDQP